MQRPSLSHAKAKVIGWTGVALLVVAVVSGLLEYRVIQVNHYPLFGDVPLWFSLWTGVIDLLVVVAGGLALWSGVTVQRWKEWHNSRETDFGNV